MFAADPVWTHEPLAGMRREIWAGWVALASPGRLDEIEARDLPARARRGGQTRCGP